QREKFTSDEDNERLFLRPRQGRPTEIVYQLEQRVSRFQATVKLAPGAVERNCGQMGIAFQVDGKTALVTEISPRNPEVAVDLDLHGHETLVVDVDDGQDGTE